MTEEKCSDCGTVLYKSPSPAHKGELEHFCKKTEGIVFGKGSPEVKPEVKPDVTPKKKKLN